MGRIDGDALARGWIGRNQRHGQKVGEARRNRKKADEPWVARSRATHGVGRAFRAALSSGASRGLNFANQILNSGPLGATAPTSVRDRPLSPSPADPLPAADFG